MRSAVSTRIDQEQLEALDRLAKTLGVQRADLLRQVVARGLDTVRMDTALEAYATQRVSLNRAAEAAGRPIPDLLDAMARRGMTIHYDRRDLKEDLAWASS